MASRKIEAILSRPAPQTLLGFRSFHGLASFCQGFTKGFNTIVAPITEFLKCDFFKWRKEAQKSFKLVKKKVIEAPILSLPDFDNVFEVECDAPNVGIVVVLSQVGKPIAFFSEKLNEGTIPKD